jgi:hypothetical protein
LKFIRRKIKLFFTELGMSGASLDGALIPPQHRHGVSSLEFLKLSSAEEIEDKIRMNFFSFVDNDLQKMSGCAQFSTDCRNPIHLEGDVARHTALVIVNLRAVASEDREAQFDNIDLLAALIHDIDKPRTKIFSDEYGGISFPEHEAYALARVPKIAQKLSLPREQEAKLGFLVGEHGLVHNMPNLSLQDKIRILSSPWWRSLRLLQKADALSGWLSPDGTRYFTVHWDEFQGEHAGNEITAMA